MNSKATLRWSVADNESLPDAVLARFRKKYSNRISTEGRLVIASQRYRDQPKNVDDCLNKLQAMILSVAKAPKTRKATKPSKGSKERRLKGKRQISEKKQQRKKLRLRD